MEPSRLSGGNCVGMSVKWKNLWPLGLVAPTGFAKTHGRLEATRVTISAKTTGRLAEVLVREGDSVESGQVVAKLDTRTLNAQLRQASMNFRSFKINTSAPSS